jgi:hypothetical protein
MISGHSDFVISPFRAFVICFLPEEDRSAPAVTTVTGSPPPSLSSALG